MKTAKIYYEGNLICNISYKKLMYGVGDCRDIVGLNGEIMGSIPNNYMIVEEYANTVEIKGIDLVSIIDRTIDRNKL